MLLILMGAYQISAQHKYNNITTFVTYTLVVKTMSDKFVTNVKELRQKKIVISIIRNCC